MKLHKRIPLAAAVIMALSFPTLTVRAGPMLAGDVMGFFQPASGSGTTVVNSDGDASFRTGSALNGSFRSGLEFHGDSFAGLIPGEALSLGLLTYYNGITRIGTSSADALLDLFLAFDDPAIGWVQLTTIRFGIDATANSGGSLVPDMFTATFLQPELVWIGGGWANFTISGLPASVQLAENTSTTLGKLTVTYFPVPEGGTTILLLGIATLCFGAWGRRPVGMVP